MKLSEVQDNPESHGVSKLHPNKERGAATQKLSMKTSSVAMTELRVFKRSASGLWSEGKNPFFLSFLTRQEVHSLFGLAVTISILFVQQRL